jgi:serine phosphatase RsbU (regulator of sigma subunit)
MSGASVSEKVRQAMKHQVHSPAEMTLAGEVQRLLFPKSSPLCSWCCMGVKNHMASAIGGDFFDFIELEDGCQAVFVGDVTGHGLHASVVMALVYGYLHRAMEERCDPLETVDKLNHFLRSFANRSERLDHFFSATLFFGVIDPRTLHMKYVNAGHPDGLVRRDGELLPLAVTGHPIGYFDHPELTMESFQLQPGDRMTLFTDGLIDGLDRAGEVFGAARLKTVIQRAESDHIEFMDELFDEVYSHLDGQAPLDDCTAIVIDMHGTVT